MGGKYTWNIEKARNLFKENGYTLLDKVYVSNSFKMTSIDSEGYKYYSTLAKMANGTALKKFHVSNIYTLDNIKLYTKIYRTNYEIISDKYIDKDSYLDILCKTHNAVFPCNWHNFQSGRGVHYVVKLKNTP